MHAFYSGGHVFSFTKQGKPSDKWPELFKDWLVNQGFVNSAYIIDNILINKQI